MASFIIAVILVLIIGGGASALILLQYRRTLREAKNYERGLKMVSMQIHIPPSSDDIESNGRDERDVTEEVLSQAQVMYNIISSTAQKGFKSRVLGQRHLSFEMISHDGLVYYYAVVPMALVDTVKQAVAAAYPTARLEEVEDKNIFSEAGKISGTIGGEFNLKKSYAYPIATYEESKRDAARALLNALSSATRDDGAAIQILFRPAPEGWVKNSVFTANKIRKDKTSKSGNADMVISPKSLMEALWKPLEPKDTKPEDRQLSSLDQDLISAIEEKTRHPGYEVLVRVVVSSNIAARSQALLSNIVAAFSLFDSPTNNGFKFNMSRNIEELVTSYIFRFFPQSINQNILNSVELATIFHLPDQSNIPTSQVQRQMAKQVDGPVQVMDEGFLLGYNEFRGVKKQIRLSTNDRRRHVYMIGQTGTGKSGLLENLAFQDMMDGKGFAFIDPHGDSVEKLLGMVPKERVDDIIYFSPGDMEYPVGLNLFEFENQDQRDFLIQEAIAMLYRLYDPGHTGIIGPRYEHWFRNASLTIMSDPAGATFIDIPQVFNDQAFTDEKLKYVTDRTVLDFWYKEMAQTSDANKSEVLGWFVSKFGAFLSNEMMRNILGQTKSGFNLREIMDNKKILLVNLSKGKTGELNSQLLGMIFVMKFQAAAMGRANMPEDQRVDFSLYVDEFQNFATESFQTILSEARKYRLNLILANQFMTQLTDNIREAIIGNIGTVISGRIGVTDAELLQKKFSPTFDAEDLTKLPNFQTVASVMINGVPSSAFSMSLVPPMGKPNPQLSDAIKKLSASRYGKPRAQVEKEIFARLGAGDAARKAKAEAVRVSQQGQAAGQRGAISGSNQPASSDSGSSFLDQWLVKRQQIIDTKPTDVKAPLVVEAGPSDGSKPTTSLDIHVADSNNGSDEGVSFKIR
ncbi:type IV secretory system conjugative DNA transfer family protein [Candidatus Saccharibacteria bacterium]|nr:type IV secretory system conjugative DNA transfer family protein [Candidatus Saccharibacteria bacterium]